MNQTQQFYQQTAQAAQSAMGGFGTQQPYNAEQFYAQAAQEASMGGPTYQPYQQGAYYQPPYQGQTQPPNGNPQYTPPQNGDTQEQTQARSFLGQFADYIRNGGFKRDIDCTAQQYNVPPKQLAQNFLEKCLGTIGDILGVAISTVGNAAHTLVDVLSTLAHGAANIVVNVASGLASFLTMNKTCVG